jgi:hypothetical protein
VAIATIVSVLFCKLFVVIGILCPKKKPPKRLFII